MKNVAIIPARGGSVRLPRKNLRLFHGKPIIAYSIEAVHGLDGIDGVIVSTDDGEIAEVATKLGARIFWRQRQVDFPATEAKQRFVNGLREVVYRPWPDDGSKGTQEVARDVLLELPQVEYACVIYATAPMISRADLIDGLTAVCSGTFNFAFGVGTRPLRDAGQFYWGTRIAFARGEPLISQVTAMIPVDEERVCDINVEADWVRAEEMYTKLKEKEEKMRAKLKEMSNGRTP